MKSTLLRLSFLAAFALAGCAAPTEEDDASSSQDAVQSDPVYDEVVRSGTKKVDTDETRNADQSARTHLVGFIRGASEDKVLDRLLTVNRWTEIKDAEGKKPFTKAEVLSDTTTDGVRNVHVKLSLDNGVTLEIKGTAKETTKGIEVRLTNSSAFKHWLIGTVLEPNKLKIDFDLIPYQGGVIVDATMKAKLKKKEEKAPELTGSVALVFDWIAAGTQR